MDEDKRFKEELMLRALLDMATNKGKPTGGEVFLDALEGMNPSDAILKQEAREQRRLANESFLPRNTSDCSWRPESKAADEERVKGWYDRLGITILGERDDLFFDVDLPEGWKVEPTNHSMHNELLDHKGRCRARIFYKGAFYDRKADIYLTRRFSISKECIDWETRSGLPFYQDRRQEEVFCRVLDCEEEIFRTYVWSFGQVYDVIPDEKDREACKKWHEEYDKFEQFVYNKCRAFLFEHYPEWEDEFAYWDNDEIDIINRLGVAK